MMIIMHRNRSSLMHWLLMVAMALLPLQVYAAAHGHVAACSHAAVQPGAHSAMAVAVHGVTGHDATTPYGKIKWVDGHCAACAAAALALFSVTAPVIVVAPVVPATTVAYTFPQRTIPPALRPPLAHT